MHIPILADIPVIGIILFQHDFIIYFSIFAVIFAISPVLFFAILNKKNIAVSKGLNRDFLDFCYVLFFVTFLFCSILSAFTRSDPVTTKTSKNKAIKPNDQLAGRIAIK